MILSPDLSGRVLSRQGAWLITGVAGFIGSNLLETLLRLDQTVIGIDNFSTGSPENLGLVECVVSTDQWSRFRFVEGDVRHIESCRQVCEGVSWVLHQAALGSVPRSLADPIATNASNIDGFLNMLVAARDAGVQSFTYAASSSTYGDHPALPKVESQIGRPLSPYAVTKLVNELYAEVFARAYGFKSIGLRYFNVFGPRQNPRGAYAAVIPRWIEALIQGADVTINGDGETSRDFCYVANAVQANILAALADDSAKNEVYNVAVGRRTSLTGLLDTIVSQLRNEGVSVTSSIQHSDFRAGDVRHSLADISKAEQRLGYRPTHVLEDGIRESVRWYLRQRAPEVSDSQSSL